MGDAVRTISAALGRALPADAEETALVRELQAGSEDAFAYLLLVYRKPIYNVVFHILGDESDAADILQNIFVKIIRGVKQFRQNSSLKTWIYRIAVHEAVNYKRSWFRRRRREVSSLDDQAAQRPVTVAGITQRTETPYEVLEQNERREMVARALRSLNEPYRTVVVLREIESLSYEQISEVLGVAEGTVKSRLKRGRELLRRKLAGCLSLQE